MYTDWGDMIEELDEENEASCFLAIMRYQSDKELPEMDLERGLPLLRSAPQFRKDEEKYSKTIANRSAAGKLGGRPKKASNSEKQKANAFDESKSKQTKTKNDNDNVNDNDLKENTLRVLKKGFAPPTPENEWILPGNGIYACGCRAFFVNYYAAKGWKIGNDKIEDWKALVRNWERQDNDQRQGMAAKDPQTAQKKSANRFANFEQRQYDYDSMLFRERKEKAQE